MSAALGSWSPGHYYDQLLDRKFSPGAEPDSPWMGKSPRNNQLSEVEVVKNLWNGTLFFVHIARRDALGGHLSWKHLQIDWQKPEPVSAMMVHVHYFGVV